MNLTNKLTPCSEKQRVSNIVGFFKSKVLLPLVRIVVSFQVWFWFLCVDKSVIIMHS